MEYPSYSLTAFNKKHIYEFDSIGNKQVIKKLIIFAPLEFEDNLYNLSFGDINEKIDDHSLIHDKVVSNNGDMQKILATIFQAVLLFTKDKEYFKIVFRGSTTSRTRLYRMAIANNYNELSQYFTIYGLNQEGYFVPFKKHTHYEGFLITPTDNKLKK